MPGVRAVRYEPRGAAKQLLEVRTPEVVVAGPAGTGKSLGALLKLHLACLAKPWVRCLIARKTAVSLTSTTLVTFDNKVIKDALETNLVSWYGGSTRQPAQYRYSNGSVIVVGGLDKPEKILSSEYDLVFVDEAIELTETDWETISTRLRNGVLPFQQQIAACNPTYPQHWLRQRMGRPGLTWLESRHRDNPAYVNADGSYTDAGAAYLAKLDALTGVRRDRLRDGRWTAAEGVIYTQWDESVHLVDRFDPPDDWPRWWSIDFGYTNPQVVQCWAEDPDGRLFLYREWYRTQRTVAEHAKDILKIVAPEGVWIEPKPRAVICDHDAEGRAVLEQELGLGTVRAHKAVSEGIQAVQERLDKRRLFLMRNALVTIDMALSEASKPICTADEIGSYVWATRRSTSGDTLTKEEPVKQDDHGLDALRYVVAELDLGVRPRVRWL